MAPSQSTRLIFGADRWLDGWSVVPTLEFVKRKVDDVLHGRPADPSLPPAIDLICNHTSKVRVAHGFYIYSKLVVGLADPVRERISFASSNSQRPTECHGSTNR